MFGFEGRIWIWTCALSIAGSWAPAALAVAQRTFVASFGADTNPCSITAPCRSFATAIGNTSVLGEVIVLDSAGYGPVTITTSVSITAPPGVYAGIFVPSGVTGVTVNGGAVVALRGLTINGQGNGAGGIDFKQGGRLNIENCLITNILGTGILLEASTTHTYITDTTVRYSAPGIQITDGQATIDRVHLENNANGGLRISTASSVPIVAVVRDSVMSLNGQSGFTVTTSATQTARLVVERSVATGSTSGFIAGGTGTTTLIIRDSSAVENSQSGIVADSPSGITTVVVSGSTSSRNGGRGFEQNGVAGFRTLQNNTVESNALGPTVGVITNANLQ